jgi:adenylate kinase family enzyme
MSKDFGFKINEPFYIVSRLPMNRVAEVVGGRNIVLKTLDANRKRQEQMFVFDNVSKTIKSKRYMDRSLNTAGNNLDMRTTNSRWF